MKALARRGRFLGSRRRPLMHGLALCRATVESSGHRSLSPFGAGLIIWCSFRHGHLQFQHLENTSVRICCWVFVPWQAAGMYVPCVDCRLRHRPCFRPFSDEELKSISSLKTNHLAIPAKTDIVTEGEVGG